jgi:hypothetical protein
MKLDKIKYIRSEQNKTRQGNVDEKVGNRLSHISSYRQYKSYI